MIQGKFCKLEPFLQSDFEKLYNIETSPERMFYFTDNMKLMDLRKYADYLNKRFQNYFHIYLVVKSISGRVVGFIYTYNYNITNGYVYMTICCDECDESSIVIGEAGILFLDYLFKHNNIRKCYADVYAFNDKSIKFLKTAGFEVEAELKKHRYYNFDYHSLYTFALYKDAFYERFKKYFLRKNPKRSI